MIDKEGVFSDEDLEAARERLLKVIDKCEAGHKLQFSKKINHSSGNVDAWINPRNKTLPSFKALHNIACEYRINLNWLVLGEGPMFMFEPENPIKKQDLEIERLKGEVSAYEKIIGKLKR